MCQSRVSGVVMLNLFQHLLGSFPLAGVWGSMVIIRQLFGAIIRLDRMIQNAC